MKAPFVVLGALMTFACVPPVQSATARLEAPTPTGKPLNQAGPFVVGVAPLAGDAGGRLRHVVAAELLHENTELAIRAVTVSALPLEVGPGEPGDTNRRLRSTLVDLHVDALVWGSATGPEGASVLRLFVAAAPRDRESPVLPNGDFGRPLLVDRWALPAQAWADVEPLLAVLVLAEAFRFDPGRYPPAAVIPLFRPMEALDRAPALRPGTAGGWSGESRWRTRAAYADGLRIVGSRVRDSESLYRSVDVWKRAVDDAPRDLAPLPWAAAQDGLGLALIALGRRTFIHDQRLEGAVAAFRAALGARSRQSVPLEWAATQQNLGEALRVWGDREASTEHLEDAVLALRHALEERTRERDPLAWAETQTNLGIALGSLGELDPAPAQSLAAVEALRAALEVFTPDETPVDWALAESNLGRLLIQIGQREEGREHLVEAVTALTAALEVQRRERDPLRWAATQRHLGVALEVLGEREEGVGHVIQAAAAFHAALEVFTRDRLPVEWALTQQHLGAALRVLATKRGKAACDAILCHFHALEIFDSPGPMRELGLALLKADIESSPEATAALCPSVPASVWALKR